MTYTSIARVALFPLLHAAAFAASPAAPQNPEKPEPPAIIREVVGVKGNTSPTDLEFTHPHVPGVRTTRDGRIGVICEGRGNQIPSPQFVLLRPEESKDPAAPSEPYPVLAQGPGLTISGALVALPPGDTASQTAAFGASVVDPAYGSIAFRVGHCCLWDESGPVHVGGQDVYTFWLVTMGRSVDAQFNDRICIIATEVEIRVDQPKSAFASIVSITADTANQRVGPILQFPKSGVQAFEPVVAANGRLLVVRLAYKGLPIGQLNSADEHDTVYAYNSSALDLDPAGWSTIHPITHAPYDPEVTGDPSVPNSQALGFAANEFRDAEGNPIPDGQDLGAGYPWIDRDAKNLLVTAIDDSLYAGSIQAFINMAWRTIARPMDPTLGLGRFVSRAADPNHSVFDDMASEVADGVRGVTLMGLWTHGKMVQIDNLNNDQDYSLDGFRNYFGAGTNLRAPQHRYVELYDPTGSTHSGEVLMGYGRSTGPMPAGENDNANIIDSIENKLNGKRATAPMTFRDVVWMINNSKWTDELVFDDYLDPDVVILAEMNGSLAYSYPSGLPVKKADHDHGNGWDDANDQWEQTTGGPRLQNAACSPITHWDIPSFGQAIPAGVDGGRLEPVAMGGVNGKGFWLTGDNGLQFDVPTQSSTTKVREHDWYVGLFVDTRFESAGGLRRVMTFPDGSALDLAGREQVLFRSAAGEVLHRVTLPEPVTGSAIPYLDDLFPDEGWAHIALQITEEGSAVTFLLNGLPLSRWRSLDSTSLFQLADAIGNGGAMTVGKPAGHTGSAFRGWIDEFKVIAHTVDPETACNHAGGTLIGFQDGDGGAWSDDFAERFPEWTHEAIREQLVNGGEDGFDFYANYYDLTQDRAIHPHSIAALEANQSVQHLRESIHFPEGPLYHNAPRPDTQTNQFCVSCHFTGAELGLGLDALARIGTNASKDSRRQPLQPPARAYGLIPADHFDVVTPAVPASSFIAPDSGSLVDEIMLPKLPGAQVAESFTVVAMDGRDLTSLQNNHALDPAILGTSNLGLRTNLDANQGSVKVTVTSVATGQVVIKRTLTKAPYTVKIFYLAPGSYVIEAKPDNGQAVTMAFSLVSDAARQIASYSEDFATRGAGESWTYAWNQGPLGDLQQYTQLQFDPQTLPARYTEFGLPPTPGSLGDGRFVQLKSDAGHPGGYDATTSTPHCAIVGFTAKVQGSYSFRNGTIRKPSSNGLDGIEVDIYSFPGGTKLSHMQFAVPSGLPASSPVTFDTPYIPLLAGDTLWFAVSPGTNDGSDSFKFDFDVYVQ